MKILRYIFMGMMAFLAVSCFDHKTGNRYVIPYVEEIVNDTTSREYQMVSSFDVLDNHGTLAVVGDPESAMRMAEVLLTFDRHDNVSGSFNPDGLPDFSGEVIAEIMDVANHPYSDFIGSNEDKLKELNVRNFLFALDTLTQKSPYDSTISVLKRKSKMIVFSSSYSSAFGCFDVDTLCKSAGREIPVFDPVNSMVSYAYERHGSPINLAVWSNSEMIGSGVYSAISDAFASRHDTSSEYEAFAPVEDTLKNEKGLLLDFLDLYLASGNTEKLSAVFLDESTVSKDSLDVALKEIVSSTDDILLKYRNILDSNFEFICPGEAIAEQCYACLRSKNAFTHRIAYPELNCYVTAPVSDSDESAYTLVEMSERYFTPSMMEYMEKYAPKSYSLYVR